jgi:Kef-type K+ transport system membrane component KefB
MASCMMEHLNVTQFLGMLVVMLGVAKVMGALAQRLGQPAVLGELIGGVLVGKSVLGLVNSDFETIHLLAELGVVILLFAIGLETDLGQLLKVGTTSMTVAIVGVALPFVLGFAACRLLGLNNLVSIMAGATLTATSVGITARVLSDLGRLHDLEGQIILGAAVIDDILGLTILTVVTGLTEGREITLGGILVTTATTVGFLVATVLVGKLVVPLVFRLTTRTIDLPGTPTAMALITALGLAWLAEQCGSAMIIGAFAAGILVVKAPQAHEIERGITEIGHFFVPLFFVAVGASVDLSALDPLKPASRFALVTGAVLIVVGVVGKLLAGYAPFWFRGNKTVVGVGMVPRGEVGLIFAQMGLASGVFDAGLFGGVTLMVMVTTLLAPPCLKLLLGPSPFELPDPDSEGIEDLVTEA